MMAAQVSVITERHTSVISGACARFTAALPTPPICASSKLGFKPHQDHFLVGFVVPLTAERPLLDHVFP
ncbi:hypothetical protein ACH4PR_52730, partial [Streptomyces mirabilis]|uniref:hypothetical protein n=1 Tax=Streptomyces mirabilis TaxID=68239 RepID=UPI0037A4B872